MSSNGLPVGLVSRITALRRDLHAHPELAFQEQRTAALVADYLRKLGLEVHTGLAGTGVVATLKAGTDKTAASIGLRADMDALPLIELNEFAHRSEHVGCMHACGHDGHVAMLLGAADALVARAQAGALAGTVHFIFQPAEEHEGGARAMLDAGLFQRFPMDAVFGLHNWPGLAVGEMAVRAGPVMAGADRFEICIHGCGGHAAMPHQSQDVVLAGAALVQNLQMLVSRLTAPHEPAVLSVTRFHAGQADNILPHEARLGGTVRTFSEEQQTLMRTAMARVCQGLAATHGLDIQLDYQPGYPPTINDAKEAAFCQQLASALFGAGRVHVDLPASMGAEDFAYMLNERPGCYVWLGNGPATGGCQLHNPHYDFNDEIIAPGIAYWVSLVESRLAI